MRNIPEIKSKILLTLQNIAPEIDPSIVDPEADIRYEYDIDSMDFLRLIVEISETYHIDIPESDYGEITTVNHLIDYINSH